MSERYKHTLPSGSAGVFGALLIALGVLFLVGQWLRVDVGHWGWPFFILVPGAALVAVGLAAQEQASERLIVVGTVITAVGLLLFYQNISDHWASWSYAWALIAPTAIGVGQVIFGTAKGHPEAVSAGTRLAGIGLVIFLAGVVFFELIIGVGGFGLGGWAWPVVLIIIGAVLLLRNLGGGTKKKSEESNTNVHDATHQPGEQAD